MNSVSTQRAAADVDRELLADLEALPAEAWSRPSSCEGWSVAAVVVHQSQVAEMLADGLARGRAGDPGPPPLVSAEGVQGWRAWRAGELARRAAQAPAAVLREYRDATAALDRELDAAGSAGAVHGWHPVGSRPAAWLADQWLFELVLHDWDIRVTDDPAVDLRVKDMAAFARTLPERLGRGFGRADDPALAGRYRVELAGAEPFVVRVGEGQVESPADDDGPVDATIQTDPAAFALVMTNRRAVESFESSGRWKASGDLARAAAFARAFRSY